jgi:hypothetical protein
MRRVFIVGGVTLVGALCGAAIASLLPQKYTSSAVVRFSSRAIDQPRFINAAWSEESLTKIIETERLYNYDPHGVHSPNGPIHKLRKTTVMRPTRILGDVALSYTDADPRRAQRVLSALVGLVDHRSVGVSPQVVVIVPPNLPTSSAGFGRLVLALTSGAVVCVSAVFLTWFAGRQRLSAPN